MLSVIQSIAHLIPRKRLREESSDVDPRLAKIRCQRPLYRSEAYLLIPGLPADLLSPKPTTRPLTRQKTPLRLGGKRVEVANTTAVTTHITKPQVLSATGASEIPRVSSSRVPTPSQGESDVVARLPVALRKLALASSSSSALAGTAPTPREAAVAYSTCDSSLSSIPDDITTSSTSSPPPPARFIAPLPTRSPIIQRIPPHRMSSPLAEAKRKVLPPFRPRPPSKSPGMGVCQETLMKRFMNSPQARALMSEGTTMDLGPKLQTQLEEKAKQEEEKAKKVAQKKVVRKKGKATKRKGKKEKKAPAAVTPAAGSIATTATASPTPTSKANAAELLKRSRDNLFMKKMLEDKNAAPIEVVKGKSTFAIGEEMDTDDVFMNGYGDGDVEMRDDILA